MATRKIFLTSGSSWTVPADCSGAVAATIECIGAGSGGTNGTVGGNAGGGGGAGAYATASLTLTPMATVYIQIGVPAARADVTMTIASPCVVTWTAHGLAANTPIQFTTTGALPTGLTAGTIYYVLAPTANTFNVSATAGGAAVNTSGTQSGVHTATANAGVTTWLNKTTNAAPASTTDGVLAKSGTPSGTGGAGGPAASSVGTTTRDGGAGGSGASVSGGGGGGSAATGVRAGSAGGTGSPSGSGGGAGGGGGTGASGAGSSSTTATGASGGLAYDASAGGTAGNPGGTKGGGGGGATAAAAGATGGAGGTGSEITDYTGSTAGGGGGAGGGSFGSTTTGGNGGAGGLYGGGGAGGGNATSGAVGGGGAGAQGLIVITYTLADDAFMPFFNQFAAVPFTLNLNFVAGTYQSGGSSCALTALPGYVYTRSGAEQVIDSDNTIDSFAANTAPVNGYGYHAYGTLTNIVQQSQSAPDYILNATATTAATTAPDGTTTGVLMIPSTTATASHVFGSGVSTTGAGTFTQSIFAKAGGYDRLQVGGYDGTAYRSAAFDLTAGTVGATIGGAAGYITSLGSGWYRCTVVATTTGAWGSSTNIICRMLDPSGTIANALGNGTGTSWAGNGTSGIYIWQHQLVTGAFSEGGPLILTTTASVTVGPPSFSVSCANGTYTATYTFDDNSTQALATSISDGTFTVGTHPTTLNRPRVKSVAMS